MFAAAIEPSTGALPFRRYRLEGKNFQSSNFNFLNWFDTSEIAPEFQSLYVNLISQLPTSITGLYQCRGDLSNSDCNTCVKRIPEAIEKICGRDTIAARVQLYGCYMRLESALKHIQKGTKVAFGSQNVADGKGIGIGK